MIGLAVGRLPRSGGQTGLGRSPGTDSFWVGLGWVGLGLAGLGWFGLGWAGLVWVGSHVNCCLVFYWE